MTAVEFKASYAYVFKRMPKKTVKSNLMFFSGHFLVISPNKWDVWSHFLSEKNNSRFMRAWLIQIVIGQCREDFLSIKSILPYSITQGKFIITMESLCMLNKQKYTW